MINWDSLNRTYNAPVVVAAVIGAVAAAGAAVYTAKKADQAADRKNAADAAKRREGIALGEEQSRSDLERANQQADQREGANAEAEAAAANTMQSSASEEMRNQELQRELAAQQATEDYAAKFKPGQGGEGEDSSSDFLVPKMDDNTGLVRSAGEAASPDAGLSTPLTFGGNY